jgi:hypothetical protein
MSLADRRLFIQASPIEPTISRPSSTATSTTEVLLSPTPTQASTPTQTSTQESTATPTATQTPIPTNIATPTNTVAPTNTAIPLATARQSAIIFMAPDDTSLQLALVAPNESVAVLGRSANRFGRVEEKPGLYVRTSTGVEGFAVALFFNWPGEVEVLPVIQPRLGVALYYTTVFQAPDLTAPEIGAINAQEVIEVLGRAGDTWLYIRLADGSQGFVERNRIDWRGDFDLLPTTSPA